VVDFKGVAHTIPPRAELEPISNTTEYKIFVIEGQDVPLGTVQFNGSGFDVKMTVSE
jgi:hypothetical protein